MELKPINEGKFVEFFQLGVIVRKVALSWIVVYPNIWDKTSGQQWETSFASVPKISPLIDQRCRLSIITKCVSLSHAVCGCRPTLSSALTYTRTHTLSLSLSLSLRLFALFPLLSVSYKSPLPWLFDIIEIQDFTVFGCSHFIGSTNTKESLNLIQLRFSGKCLGFYVRGVRGEERKEEKYKKRKRERDRKRGNDRGRLRERERGSE